MKIFLFYLFFMFFIFEGFSISYFSEIDFKDEYFVEIVLNESLDLEDSKLYDDGDFDELEKIKESNNLNYLIVEDTFIEDFNLDYFDCNIYKVQDGSLGHYGLKNTGESLVLNYNSTFNVSYFNNLTLNTYENKSLNYNLTNYFYDYKNPCGIYLHNNSQIKNIDTSIYQLDIEFENEISYGVFNETLEFKILTNVTNYTVEYWVENLTKVIAKNKANSSNQNTKRYTPDSSEDFFQIFIVFANLYVNNTFLKSTNKTITYLGEHLKEEIIITSSSTKEIEVEKIVEIEKDDDNYLEYGDKTFFEIRNLDEILNGSSNIIDLFFYKSNDTQKRTLYFNANRDEIFKISNIKKFDKFEHKIFMPIIPNEVNEIKISGFDLDETYTFNYTPSEKEKPKKQEEFKFSNIFIKENILTFEIEHILEIEGECYLRYGNKLISNKIKISNKENQKIELKIDLAKLTQNSNKDSYNVVIYCKYKKTKNKTFKYAKLPFALKPRIIETQIKIENETQLILEEKELNTSTVSNSNINLLAYNQNIENEKIPSNSLGNKYTSKQFQNKDNAIFYSFMAISVLLIVSILRR